MLQLFYPLVNTCFSFLKLRDFVLHQLHLIFQVLIFGLPVIPAFFKESDQFSCRALIFLVISILIKAKHGLNLLKKNEVQNFTHT